MVTVLLEVVGLPSPQGSKTAYVRGGRAVIVDGRTPQGRAGHKAWRKAVHDAAQSAIPDVPEAPLDEPLSVSIHFRLPLPATDLHRTRHATPPDIDKLVRATLDSLTTSGLIRDDSRIYALRAVKTYACEALPGATIEIERHGEDERSDRQMSIRAAAARRKEARARQAGVQ